MRLFSACFILLIFGSCLVAPEFDRNSEYDLKTGEPKFRNLRYFFNPFGIYVGWMDGSLLNDDFIVTQKKYTENDSLIIETVLPGDANYFTDYSGEFGTQYTVIISSNNRNSKGEITEQTKDTLDINFGTIELGPISVTGDSLEFIVDIKTPSTVIESIFFDVNSSGSWERYSEVPSHQRTFAYPSNQLSGTMSFRFGLTVKDFKGGKSVVDSITITQTF